MVDPGVDDADESVVHPEVEPQQAKETRWHHPLKESDESYEGDPTEKFTQAVAL